MNGFLALNRKAITKIQAAVIAVIIIVAVIAGVVYYCYFAAGPAPPPKEKVVIGIVQSLSGPNAGGCALHHVYYKWIIEDYNKEGGLYVPEYGKKLPIEYIEYDDESNLEKMLSLTEKLIVEDKVDLCLLYTSDAADE